MTERKRKVLIRAELEDRRYPEGHQVMRRIARALANGTLPDTQDIETFGDMVKALDAGEKSDKALKLQTGRGRKAPRTIWENRDRFAMALEVAEAVSGGATRETACAEVGDRWGKDERTVGRYYDANRRAAEAMLGFLEWGQRQQEEADAALQFLKQLKQREEQDKK